MHVHLSYCQSVAKQITAEVDTVAGIDCQSTPSHTKVAVLEAKRATINALIDDMIAHVKERNPDHG